jgi:hypothetical protein
MNEAELDLAGVLEGVVVAEGVAEGAAEGALPEGAAAQVCWMTYTPLKAVQLLLEIEAGVQAVP